MLKYLLSALFIITSASGLTLPQVLEQDHYLIPTYTGANLVTFKAAVKPTLHSVPKKTDDDAGPKIESKAALIMDASSGVILWQKNETVILPIASITKLITALVALDYIQDWDATYAYTPPENALSGAEVVVGNGDEFTKHDILKTALVASANNAAAALAHSTGLSDAQFRAAMNVKAQQLGMLNSMFVEPTGLEAGNVSTVKELALLMRTVSHEPMLMEPLSMIEHRMTRRNPNTGNEVIVHTTNRLIKNHDLYVLAGKTGFTYEAGDCLLTLATNQAGNRIIVALLGGPDPTTRFEETQELIRWTYEHYEW